MRKDWPSLLVGWLVAVTANGCTADQRSLGSYPLSPGDADAGAEDWVPFGAVTLHPALVNAPASQHDPSLTADELELYYATAVDGTLDIWLCQRASSASAWGTPGKVIELSSDSMDENPNVSADGLTMYLASDRPGGVAAGEHLWVSHRATRADSWAQPVPVTDFAVGDADKSPSVQSAELIMVFASQRGSTDWELYATTRQSATDLWGAPAPLTELNSPEVNWDPALYQGGNGIVFASQRLGGLNSLFYASRESVTNAFSVPQPATELNSNDENDPWLSDDGQHIVFDSDRSGQIKIYEAWR
ncbi:MAG: hypothetical protein ABSF35_15880 [Polyangia bacterium]|jgi:hypothetical protein